MKNILVCLAFLSIVLPTYAQNLSGIVNTYTVVNGYDGQCGCLTVSSAKEFAKGDRVLIIQMQGASVNTSNTPLFGSVSNQAQAGKFEFGTIATINANTISLSNQLTNRYDYTNGSVQLVKVATGADIVTSGVLTAKAWDGSTGGVLVVESSNSLTINGAIDLSGKGFRGGESSLANLSCNQRGYAFNGASMLGAAKGEGIAKFDQQMLRGRGAWANGGGGGNNHNAGGGGGGNAWNGGFGGFAWGGCAVKNDAETRGTGGFGLTYTSLDTRACMGGGGGAGHRNDNNPSSGANGGGIIILVAQNITILNGSIITRGSDAAKTEMDGAGGGGAGGTVVLFCENIANNLTVDIRGGKGGDARNPHGPGGGGSAGVVLLKQDQIPAVLTVLNQGGQSGINYELGAPALTFVQNPYGATDGEKGVILSSVRMPMQGANANTVRVVSSGNKTVCKGNGVQLNAVASGSSNYSYTWTPAEGLSDSTIANPIARPKKTTTYTVSVKDARGCVDSDSLTITVGADLALELGADRSICKGNSVKLDTWTGGGSGVVEYQWSPTTGLSNSSIQNPIAAPEQNTTYTLTITDVVTGCFVQDSVRVLVRNMETPNIVGDSIVCQNTTHRYTVQSSVTTPFLWSVSGAKDMVMEQGGLTAVITWGKEGSGKVCVSGDMGNNICVASVKMNIVIVPEHKPVISASASTTICEGDTLSLEADIDYAEYRWSNGTTTPTLRVSKAGVYTLEATSYAGCSARSNSIEVKVVTAPMPKISIIGNAKPCANESVRLDAGAWASYRWSNGAQSRTITVEQSGEYVVEVSNSNGCTATSAPVRITRNGDVQPRITGKTLVCASSLQLYRAQGMPGSSFTWHISGAQEVNYFNVRNDSVAVLWGAAGEGKVTVEEITTEGCSGVQQTTVHISTITAAKIAATATEIEDGDVVTMDAGAGYTAYRWSTGDTTQSIQVKKAGEYSVEVWNEAGCTTKNTISLLHRNSPVLKVYGRSHFCEGESTTLDAGEVQGNIVWSNGVSGRSITVSRPGAYYYVVFAGNNRRYVSDTMSVVMNNNPKPVVRMMDNILMTNAATRYQWLLNGKNIEGATGVNYIPTEAGKYSVIVTNQSGCTNVSEQLAYLQTPSVHVSLPRISAKPGERFLAVLRVQTTKGEESISGAYTARISFSSALLYPIGKTPVGTVYNGKRSIEIHGTVGENGVLNALEFLALSGDSSSTALTIDEIHFATKAEISSENGEFILTPTCALSGNRPVAFGEAVNLKQNYPNPFQNTTTIEYTLLENGMTSLSVYDMKGTMVATILNGMAMRGSYAQVFDGSNLSSGSYVLVLQTPSKRISKEMMITR